MTTSTLLASRQPLHGDLTPERLDRLVFEQGFPLYRPDITVFAFRGDADEVHLVHFGIGLPDDLHFERLGESSWWTLCLDLPAGTRLEYQLGVIQGDDRHTFKDPLNPFESRNPFGSNSVCRSSGYAVPPWAIHEPHVPAGSQRSLTIPSRALDRPVSTTIYLPAGFDIHDPHRYPLLVLHDGTDYLHFADASVVLDNLIDRGLIPEMVVAFCDPADRLREYANDERHAAFIADELVPYLDAHLPLISDPRSRCLGGASFGAIAALSTAVRRPHVFERLLLQSGSFVGATHGPIERDDPLWAPVQAFVRGYVEDPQPVARLVTVSCGLYEPLILEHRAMRSILRQTGMTVMSAEILDGHTWGCWRDDLGISLPWLFVDHERRRPIRPYERSEVADRFTTATDQADSGGGHGNYHPFEDHFLANHETTTDQGDMHG